MEREGVDPVGGDMMSDSADEGQQLENDRDRRSDEL